MQINGFRDLIVYQKSYALSIEVFEMSKFFPNDEKYSLTEQIRRSSRSIPANIAESWAKRMYIKAFINKLSDALAEEFETEVWLNMSRDIKYLDNQKHDQLISKYEEIRKMLVSMINNPDKFCK